MTECQKCGAEIKEGGCPVYHGRTGDGFCPSFADGETALETTTRFHAWWLREARKNDDLEDKIAKGGRLMRRATFLIWIILSLAIIAIAWMTLIRTARAEFCHAKIDNNVERLSGFRWSWRMVDGRKCWYFSRHILPREDLVWSFTEQEFNADIERVIERKFYKPIFDEHQLLIEED